MHIAIGRIFVKNIYQTFVDTALSLQHYTDGEENLKTPPEFDNCILKAIESDDCTVVPMAGMLSFL